MTWTIPTWRGEVMGEAFETALAVIGLSFVTLHALMTITNAVERWDRKRQEADQ